MLTEWAGLLQLSGLAGILLLLGPLCLPLYALIFSQLAVRLAPATRRAGHLGQHRLGGGMLL